MRKRAEFLEIIELIHTVRYSIRNRRSARPTRKAKSRRPETRLGCTGPVHQYQVSYRTEAPREVTRAS